MRDYIKCPDIIKEVREHKGEKEEKGSNIVFILVGFLILVFLMNLFAERFEVGVAMFLPKILKGFKFVYIMRLASILSYMLQIFVIILVVKFYKKRKIGLMGFVKKNMIKDYFIGLLIGFVSCAIVVGVCVLTGSVKVSFSNIKVDIIEILLWFIMFIFQGMTEEVLCRGYLMVEISRRYSLIVAVTANVVLFGILHCLNSGITFLSVVNIVLFGLVFSLFFIKRGNIWLVAGFHSMWNFVQGNFFGIKVSGTDVDASVLKTSLPSGNDIFNGGHFGIEGGIATTIVCSLILVYMVVKMWNKKSVTQVQG